jgi:hypothetical protein
MEFKVGKTVKVGGLTWKLVEELENKEPSEQDIDGVVHPEGKVHRFVFSWEDVSDTRRSAVVKIAKLYVSLWNRSSIAVMNDSIH